MVFYHTWVISLHIKSLIVKKQCVVWNTLRSYVTGSIIYKKMYNNQMNRYFDVSSWSSLSLFHPKWVNPVIHCRNWIDIIQMTFRFSFDFGSYMFQTVSHEVVDMATGGLLVPSQWNKAGCLICSYSELVVALYGWDHHWCVWWLNGCMNMCMNEWMYCKHLYE